MSSDLGQQHSPMNQGHTSANDPKRKVQPDFFLYSFGTLGCFILVLLNIVNDRFLDLSPHSSSLGSIIICLFQVPFCFLTLHT